MADVRIIYSCLLYDVELVPLNGSTSYVLEFVGKEPTGLTRRLFQLCVRHGVWRHASDVRELESESEAGSDWLGASPDGGLDDRNS